LFNCSGLNLKMLKYMNNFQKFSMDVEMKRMVQLVVHVNERLNLLHHS
jgi:hypothetical protein